MNSKYDLAISYLQIYVSNSNRDDDDGGGGGNIVQENGSRNGSRNGPSDLTNEDAPRKDDDVVWEEYEWTSDNEEEARSLLEKSLERCRIQSIPTYHVLKDDYAWDNFYSQHHTNFFKDRHYLHYAFPNEFGSSSRHSLPTTTTTTATSKIMTLVEIGCGVGNALLPLLETTTTTEADTDVVWMVYGLDLSPVAIDLLKKDSRFQAASEKGLAFAFATNIVDGIPLVCQYVADVSSLLFCLSAIDPNQQPMAVRNVAATLRPGGTVVFRDYGRFDESQLKLGSQRGKLLKDNFYMKHDATKCYFFTTLELQNLFETAGLEVIELHYVRRIYKNRALNATRRRVWVQGRFRKPLVGPKPNEGIEAQE